MCFSLQNKTHHNSQTSPLVVQICVYQLIVRNLGPPGKRYERFYLPLSFVAFSFLLLLLLLLLFLIPFTIFALLFLSLLVVTQIRGHRAGSSPPLPSTVRALHFYWEKISVLKTFSFLPSLTRVELCLPTLGALSSLTVDLFIFLQMNSKSHHGGIYYLINLPHGFI